MSYETERRVLRETGMRLVEKGLVARTWGNVSIRLDEKHMLISPSGRSYETVRPEEIALVNIEDLGWEGPLKPSSERELHARIYRVREDAGAVIHTHQPAASSLAAARVGLVLDRREDVFGAEVPCVPYALPTTARLAKAVERLARSSRYKALLLSNHGAVCIGTDMGEALQLAEHLEDLCGRYVLEAFRKATGSSGGTEELLEHYVGGKV